MGIHNMAKTNPVKNNILFQLISIYNTVFKFKIECQIYTTNVVDDEK